MPACALGWMVLCSRLKREPPVACEQHLDPYVGVIAPNQVAPSSCRVPDLYPTSRADWSIETARGLGVSVRTFRELEDGERSPNF